MQVASHALLQAVLDGLGAELDAAEAHGCLCGALCARDGFGVADWVGELLNGESPMALDASSGESLEALLGHTLQTLRSGEFDFAPLLPDDSQALEARVDALGAWCSGFLYGVGAGGVQAETAAIGDVGEILEDFGEISRARIDPEETAEAGEAAYVELYEFVRAGAQLAYDELAVKRAAQAAAAPVLH